MAEAQFRVWLNSFLPKRYSVTSGYIVSPGLKSTDITPHYDVIIFDQLESPILWVEDNPDHSSQGSSLAIPVEHVKGVLEVKSIFSSKSVGEAMEHLKDLLPLMGGLDEPSDRYKLHLGPSFCCGLIFFDLKSDSQFSKAALKKINLGRELRGFFGGIVLRGEGHTKPLTGTLSLLQSKTPIEGTIRQNKQSLLNMGMSQSVQIAENLHLSSMISWSESEFSRFAFDLLAMIQDKYEVGRLSSFHGMGGSDWQQIKA